MLAAAVLAWMGVLCVCDVRQRRLPNWLTLPGAGVILLFAGLAGRGVPALAGAAALAGCTCWCTWLCPPRWAPVTSSWRSVWAG